MTRIHVNFFFVFRWKMRFRKSGANPLKLFTPHGGVKLSAYVADSMKNKNVIL